MIEVAARVTPENYANVTVLYKQEKDVLTRFYASVYASGGVGALEWMTIEIDDQTEWP
jgi:hypothetical protein